MEEKINEEFNKSWNIDDKYEEEERNTYMRMTLREIKQKCFDNISEKQKIEDIKALIHDYEREYGNV